eukprot:TRINITY_DN659_c0_g1_i16.p1 TRINITY_DN659_c0_g1~~TRINITY_DN659_c0_g1_i16.p1  ORF type:complete len:293 (-),score=-22.15 TRINITY_DN659_c0_g1_i16:262-1140(-)
MSVFLLNSISSLLLFAYFETAQFLFSQVLGAISRQEIQSYLNKVLKNLVQIKLLIFLQVCSHNFNFILFFYSLSFSTNGCKKFIKFLLVLGFYTFDMSAELKIKIKNILRCIFMDLDQNIAKDRIYSFFFFFFFYIQLHFYNCDILHGKIIIQTNPLKSTHLHHIIVILYQDVIATNSSVLLKLKEFKQMFIFSIINFIASQHQSQSNIKKGSQQNNYNKINNSQKNKSQIKNYFCKYHQNIKNKILILQYYFKMLLQLTVYFCQNQNNSNQCLCSQIKLLNIIYFNINNFI